ncbi:MULTISPECIES: ABC transporter permease subunit [unclassified Leptolyngbya]|uniref:PhnE/PtxC family ABC transporter permease n=1 Tax=unclassified Leptolyngbya TaxID=2650499 RepID=UPI00168892EB|nr:MULTISPECIES: ABC transporter permease subunit [unclassified Leptolyngbya]MBD1910599.1 ABC transporter permease subunit [Leptolyngbya sp. FACHB-8]MBD2154539.1 ABC transporter permease subunit [Leptolyngbya sp. FACHB-16]
MAHPSAVRSWWPALANPRIAWGLVALGAIAFSLYPTGLFRQDILNPGGLPQLGQFLAASLQPDFSPEFLALALNAAIITLAYAVCGTVFSIALGLIGGVWVSEVWWKTVFPQRGGRVRAGIRFLLAIPRAIHELIWGLFFINIFGLDPLVAILAIAIPYGAIVAKVFSEILDETPRQPLLALLSSGVAPLTAFTYSLIPQAGLNLLSYTFYRFECSIRSAAVLGIIGAGGLGYEILLSLQSLRYNQLWTLFYALFLLNGLVDLSSAWVRRRLGSPSRLDLNFRKLSHRAESQAAAQITPAAFSLHSESDQRVKLDPILLLAGVAIVLLIPFCFNFVQADFSKLWSARTFELLVDIGQSALPPRFEVEQWQQLLGLSLQTLAMSILAIALAGFGGILLSFPAAYNFFLPGGLLATVGQSRGGRILAWVSLLLTRSLLLIARAIPAPIWALVALFVLFPGMLPGAIALSIHNLGILGRLMAEVNENLDQRPLIALKSLGAPGPLVFLYGVLPLTFTRFLAYTLYRWEVCMRETVIVGLVGAGGLGRLLTEQLTSFDYRSVIVTLGCFVVLTFVVDWVSGTARRSLR